MNIWLIPSCVVFVTAIYVSVQSAIVCDLVGAAQLAKGIGLSIVFFGIVQVLATSLAGKEIYSTFIHSFLVQL